jgi:hypothetical protein
MIDGWLKAGVVEMETFSPTEEGTPQGGVISPLLMNVALHGMAWKKPRESATEPVSTPLKLLREPRSWLDTPTP